jgi:hypothetical protein
VLAAALLVACSSDGGGQGSSTAVTLAPAGQSAASAGSAGSPSSAATLPSSVEPGVGALQIGASLVRFAVTGCSFTPETDASNGVTTNVLVTGDDGKGGAVSISQKQAAGGGGPASTTVTEVVTYSQGGGVMEAMRFQIGGVWRDVRDPVEGAPLLAIKDGEVLASALFGQPGAVAGDPALVRGSLVARCP